MRRIFLLTLLLTPLWVLPAAADDEVGHNEARRLRESGDILPLDAILEQARRHHPGKVLEVDLERKRGRLVYELELLDDQGMVWELRFDASNAELLQQEKDD